jgi:hypothetical protein
MADDVEALIAIREQQLAAKPAARKGSRIPFSLVIAVLALAVVAVTFLFVEWRYYSGFDSETRAMADMVALHAATKITPDIIHMAKEQRSEVLATMGSEEQIYLLETDTPGISMKFTIKSVKLDLVTDGPLPVLTATVTRTAPRPLALLYGEPTQLMTKSSTVELPNP